MGRKDVIRSIVLQCFLKQPSNSNLYQCQYCSQQYALNVTRMSDHLLKKCVNCPLKIKIDIHQKTKASTTNANKSKDTSSTAQPIKVELDELDTDSEKNSNNSSISTSTFPELPSTAASLDSFGEKTHQSEDEKVWELLARACYANDTPLNITENFHWKKLFNKINPSLKLPSSYQLTNSLLEKEHKRIYDQVNNKIKIAKTVGIQIDDDKVIITTPDPVLYKVDNINNQNDVNYLSNLFSSIIDEIGIDKIMSIVTENACNMRTTLKEKYSSGYFSCYECCANILNLLIDDLLEIELFSSTTQTCKTIIETINGSYILETTFTHIQKVQHNLKNSSTTKLLNHPASIIVCLQSLRLNKENLKQLAITETVLEEISPEVKQNIFDDLFWQNVEILCNLLQPISEYIKNRNISEVIEIFHNLISIFNNNCPPLYLDVAQGVLQKRKKMLVRPVHFAANLLDPKYMGKNLTSDEYISALTYINKLSSHLIDDQVMTEVALYKTKEEFFSKDFLWTALSTGRLNSITWWKSFCLSTNLSKVAVEILNCPARTCASFDNKKTNQVTTTNNIDAKLIFINCNLKLFAPKTVLLQHDEPSTSQSSNSFVPENLVLIKREYDSEREFVSQ